MNSAPSTISRNIKIAVGAQDDGQVGRQPSSGACSWRIEHVRTPSHHDCNRRRPGAPIGPWSNPTTGRARPARTSSEALRGWGGLSRGTQRRQAGEARTSARRGRAPRRRRRSPARCARHRGSLEDAAAGEAPAAVLSLGSMGTRGGRGIKSRRRWPRSSGRGTPSRSGASPADSRSDTARESPQGTPVGPVLARGLLPWPAGAAAGQPRSWRDDVALGNILDGALPRVEEAELGMIGSSAAGAPAEARRWRMGRPGVDDRVGRPDQGPQAGEGALAATSELRSRGVSGPGSGADRPGRLRRPSRAPAGHGDLDPNPRPGTPGD
jgi:hypothetical protein